MNDYSWRSIVAPSSQIHSPFPIISSAYSFAILHFSFCSPKFIMKLNLTDSGRDGDETRAVTNVSAPAFIIIQDNYDI